MLIAYRMYRKLRIHAWTKMAEWGSRPHQELRVRQETTTLNIGWHFGHCQNAFQMSSVPLYPYLKIQSAKWYHLRVSRSCCQGQGTFSGSWLQPRITRRASKYRKGVLELSCEHLMSWQTRPVFPDTTRQVRGRASTKPCLPGSKSHAGEVPTIEQLAGHRLWPAWVSATTKKGSPMTMPNADSLFYTPKQN